MGQRGQEQRPRRGLIALVAILTLVVLVIDQASKQVVVNTLEVGQFHPLLGDFLGLSLVFNPGAAFSLAEGSTWVFTIAAVVVTVVIVRISRRLGSRGWAVALGALLGGTLGNLGDRLFREPGFAVGHVVDFINYNGWFVGNVADIAIVLSAVAIAVLSFGGIGVDGQRAAGSQRDGAPAEGKHVATPADEQEPAEDEAGDPDEAGAADSPAQQDGPTRPAAPKRTSADG
ncbi:signal peptidase II [Ruania albidiflava]|uniref:signal peptidase II n=1 Tax=Ruania albidiflava TaxID=366586 RepID=UPI0003B524B5|nr:signal peptidase II [Ruania albidiflava]